MTEARVSQVPVEVLRTNLAVSAQVSQVAVEVLRPNAALGLFCAAGSFTLTGQSASPTYIRTLSAAADAFTLTGQSANFTYAYVLQSGAGAFVLAGQDAALKLPGKIDGAAGALTLTGQTATLGRKLALISSVGAFVLSGQASTAKHPYRSLSGAPATFVFNGKDVALSYPRDIVDPVTGLTILHKLRTNSPAYADADAAYNAWASTLGVDSTGTDYTVSSGVEGIDFVPLALPILDGSVYAGVNIPHSGAIGMYMSPPSVMTGVSTAYSWGIVSLGRLTLATDRPAFTIRAFNNTVGTLQYQNTNLKLRKAYNPTTGAYEVIVIMTSASTASPQYPIRCAYRMAAGYLEAVFTVNAIDIPAGGYFYIGYIVGNESTDIAVDGSNLFATSTAGTFGVVSDDYSALRPYMSESALTTDTLVTKKNSYPTVTDTQEFRDAVRSAWGLTINQTAATTDAAVYAFHPGALIEEVIALADAQPREWNFVRAVTESVRLADALATAFPVSVADTATISSAAAVVRAVLVLEQLRLIDPATVAGDFYVQVVDALVASDSLRRFFGGELADTVGVSESLSRLPRLSKTASEAFAVTDTLTNKLILRVTAQDNINLDDATPTKWLFKPTLTDNVDIEIGYIQPNGAFTTWAVNTRTGAVTEYQNYEFNSFANLGHKYLGAASSGLYELNGDDDDGTDIIAQIKSGLAQFGGSRYSSFKAAYLGMRGDGNIILKLETGDGNSYTYQTVIQDMQSTKVRLGKGLRARYFSFELISTGPDFDLDTVEFIPLVAQRRV